MLGGVKLNSHRHARYDETVSSVSSPLWRCELDSRQLETVADKSLKSQHVQSNRTIHTGTPDTTRLSRLPVDRRRRDVGQTGSYA